MQKNLLEILRCPYCGSMFELSEVMEAQGEDIVHGCLQCECNSFPILEGIPLLINNPAKKYVLNYLREGEIKKAFALSINKNSRTTIRIADFINSKPLGTRLKNLFLDGSYYFSKKQYERYFDQSTCFCDLLKPGLSGDYLKHRFSSQTFWSLYPFIPLIQRKKRRILDVCCGSGHASFVISRYVNPEELVCVDADFRHLYLAKKYFSEAEFINADANGQLPFKDNIFSSVIMMDSFHYIDAKSSLSKELFRMLEAEGNLLLLHIHNSLLDNYAAGGPLSPKYLQNLFKEHAVRILPENKIVEDFIWHDRIDLSCEYTSGDLVSSNLILIKSPYREEFSNIWSKISPNKGNLIINPIYKTTFTSENKIVLERNFPNEFFRKENPISENYLIEEYELHTDDLKSGKSIDNLLRRFILLNVPEKYIKSDFCYELQPDSV
jgi:ubiquinone/menaquinone biosynthesis C-methylase UbiE/uncharacterized protein YbaR (Trm112 family)